MKEIQIRFRLQYCLFAFFLLSTATLIGTVVSQSFAGVDGSSASTSFLQQFQPSECQEDQIQVPAVSFDDLLAETVEEELEVRKKKVALSEVVGLAVDLYPFDTSFFEKETGFSPASIPFYVLFHQWKTQICV